MNKERLVERLCRDFPGFGNLTRGGKLAVRTVFEQAVSDVLTGQTKESVWEDVKKALLHKNPITNIIGFLWDGRKIAEGVAKVTERFKGYDPEDILDELGYVPGDDEVLRTDVPSFTLSGIPLNRRRKES